MLSSASNLSEALRHGKHWVFIGVTQDCDDHVLKHLAPPLNNVQMPQGNGIEATGIDGNHTLICSGLRLSGGGGARQQ